MGLFWASFAFVREKAELGAVYKNLPDSFSGEMEFLSDGVKGSFSLVELENLPVEVDSLGRREPFSPFCWELYFLLFFDLYRYRLFLGFSSSSFPSSSSGELKELNGSSDLRWGISGRSVFFFVGHGRLPFSSSP